MIEVLNLTTFVLGSMTIIMVAIILIMIDRRQLRERARKLTEKTVSRALNCASEHEAWWLIREVLDLLRLHELELKEVCPSCQDRDEFWRIVRSPCPPTVTIKMVDKRPASPPKKPGDTTMSIVAEATDDRFNLN
ncbi:hypothetical protein A2480_00030 [Candidatus Uhrbacteria bacterium RIFOXYC2_FULL_47_19]|uniref:Transmembrane protein n=1 Tax=Candidatus Uhrbacteria bacterium RIFOXYC2_FULL_47_19 TaxID=1802424 RepID=A0A1F7WFQ7_9BACT|nr:MAG: hypothetical protein A2480_00030 [Candidatus Uhrbacteria bacterium RIFOXYC2_FULL_47_19]HCC22288.1 hypothetical protein [Candidatus Uhrbacteria bacterium]